MTVIKKIFVVLMITMIICSVFSLEVYAAEKTYWCNVCQENHKGEFKNSLNEFAWEVSDTINGGNIFDNSLNTILQMNMSNTGNVQGQTFDAKLQKSFKDMWAALKVPYEALAIVGKLLMVIYVMVQTFETTSIKNIQAEELLKMTLKWCVGAIIINNGYYILSLFVDIGASVFGSVYAAPTVLTDGSNCIFDKALKYQWTEAAASILWNVLPWVIMQFAKVVVSIAAWSRLLELSARTVLAPVGMADLITEGIHGNGMRYLRKFLGCALQGAIILASVKVYGAACSSMSLDLITHCALTCMLIVIMLRSKDFANQITGAA